MKTPKNKIWCLAAVLSLMAGCAGPGQSLQDGPLGYRRDSAAAADSPRTAVRWQVLLAAVGNEQNVFDNFVNDFGERIVDHPDIASVRTLHASKKDDTQAATYRGVTQAIDALHPKNGEGCFLYLTGHGQQGGGIVMSADKPKVYVSPSVLEKMLAPCTGRPTVVVVSACFSGIYMREGIATPERVVLTASSPDAASFGCSSDETYTYFDRCFMDAWGVGTTWESLSDATAACVRRKEAAKNAAPSDPQSFFGREVRAMALPARGGTVRLPPAKPS